MYPTEKPVEQAKLCLSCHVGDNSRAVSHRIMGAGHPRLSFELETFSQLAPAHYKIDDDWHKRKGDYDSVRLWAIGQALASKNQLDMLTDPKRGRDGMFPELALFDCHACHHPMSEKKWTARLGVGPGRMRLNDSNLLMLRAIVRATDPTGANAFSDQVTQLHQAVAGNATTAAARGADPIALANALSLTIQRYIVKLEQQRFTPLMQRAVLLGLIDEAKRQQFSDYAGAEQAYMAISSLSSSLAKQGALGGAAGVAEMNRKLAALRVSLANEDAFKPDVFANGLQGLSRTISLQAN
jgi:hypothetical protein